MQSSSPSYSFVISGNRNLVANFTANIVAYSVSGVAETNGEIDPAGSQSVSIGQSVNFIATPTNGYQVGQWFVGGLLAQTGGTNFALVNVNSNTTVAVSFAAEPTVVVTASSTNAGSVIGGGAFVAGSTVTALRPKTVTRLPIGQRTESCRAPPPIIHLLFLPIATSWRISLPTLFTTPCRRARMPMEM